MGRGANKGDNASDDRGGDLAVREPQNPPSGECGFEVLLGVSGEAGGAVVTAACGEKNPAFDFDDRPALKMCEVGSPTAFRIEAELGRQVRAAERRPE